MAALNQDCGVHFTTLVKQLFLLRSTLTVDFIMTCHVDIFLLVFRNIQCYVDLTNERDFSCCFIECGNDNEVKKMANDDIAKLKQLTSDVEAEVIDMS